MNEENKWTSIQSFSIGQVKIGGDAVIVKEDEEEKKEDGDKQKSNGKNGGTKTS